MPAFTMPASKITPDNAKAYAAELTGGRATYAQYRPVTGVEGDTIPCFVVRVRMPDYSLAWVDVWLERPLDQPPFIYGEW